MNAPATIKPDSLTTILGPIPEAERERRAKLMALRNAAGAMVGQTKSDTARTLAWLASDWAHPFIFDRAAPIEFLDKVNQLVSRLMPTAFTAEEIDALLREAERDDD